MLDTSSMNGGGTAVETVAACPRPTGNGSRMILGRLSVFPNARALLSDGVAVDLGSRAFDLLIVLLLARGQVVTKEAIMRYVWPTNTVDECNLRFQTKILRRALGVSGCLIKTITGRGYMIAEEIPRESDPAPFPEAVINEAESHEVLQDAVPALLRASG